MIFTRAARLQLGQDLAGARKLALRALSTAESHSVRLTRKLTKICAELEAAQEVALRMRTSSSEGV